MLHASLPKPTCINQTLITVLDQCKSMHELKQIFALITTLGLSQDDRFVSKIFSFSALSDWGDINYSHRLFSQLHNPKTFYWNTIIRGYSNSKNPNPSVSVFIKMLRVGVSPNHLTYPFLVKASARLLKLELGAAVHTHVLKTGFESDRFIQNSLIHGYAKCGDAISAWRVFELMPERNVVSWSSLIDGYVKSGKYQEAMVHTHVLKTGFESDRFIQNSLIHGYAKCGDVISARRVFELMPERNVASWTSLIDGYVKSGEYQEAMVVFENMRAAASGTKANEVTMVSVLCACAHLGALEQGRMMHQYVIDNGLPLTLNLRTSLVNMYAKCGAIPEALNVFHGVPKSRTNVSIWTTVIGGLAKHGLVKESLELFTEMQIVGITPNEITYLCLLTACAHGGLVKEAWDFFDCLGKHGMTPKSEHYACMVDVLARAGQVAEAYQFISQMPVEPTASMLGALLSGCMNHGKLNLAEIVGRKLIELEPDDGGRYVGLSNIYAAEERWDDVRTMRDAMLRRGVKNSPGLSFVEIFGNLHRFVANDKIHPDSEKIYVMLKFITSQIQHDTNYENLENCMYDMKDV